MSSNNNHPPPINEAAAAAFGMNQSDEATEAQPEMRYVF
jgi:hypothetical protein